MNKYSVTTVVAAIIFILPFTCAAFDGVVLYLEPSIEATSYMFKSIEIDDSFIKLPAEGDAPVFDENDLSKVVGLKSRYKGNGLAIGVGTGIKLHALGIGLNYTWSPVWIDGYWKRYRYDSVLQLARGRKVLDKGRIDLQRVLLEFCYGLPLGTRFELGFKTRIGRLYIDNRGMVMGHATNSGKGLTADLGIAMDVKLASFFSIGLNGWYGVFMFDGAYDGAFGTTKGFGTSFTFEI